MLVVDAAGARPGRGGAPAPAAAAPLGAALFAARPGLRVLQLAWHPDSDRHLAVLTGDATWRLFDAAAPALAEQTFELAPGGRRALGLPLLDSDDDDAGGGGAASTPARAAAAAAAPVAFSFGPREGWDRFAVYFLFADGALRTLCPVVPFHARLPARALRGLAAAAHADARAAAWIERAFEPVRGAGAGGAGAELVAAVPAALDEHAPALAGPLRVEARGSAALAPAAALPGGGEDLLVWRAGEGATALAAASRGGRVAAGLLAGGAAPAWCNAPPQCLLEGGALRAVRSQAAAAPPGRQRLLLLDAVDVGAPPRGASEAEPELAGAGGRGARHRRLALLADPAAPETLFAVHAGGAAVITLRWLPALAEALAGGGAPPAALPPPAAERLCAAPPGVAAAAAVGDALCGSALVVLRADGSAACLRLARAPAAAAASGGDAAAREAAAAAEDAARVEAAYGELRRGPAAPPPPAAPAGAGAPERQRLLAERTAALRAAHVEYAYRAHHALSARRAALGGELEEQRARAGAAAAAAADAEERGRRGAARLARAAALQDNLAARLRLLAELHWALPQPASRAEAALRDEELPALEAAAARAEGAAADAAGRLAALRRQLRPLGEAAAAARPAADAAPPPAQLRRVREALCEHERAIRAAAAQVGALRAALATAEA